MNTCIGSSFSIMRFGHLGIYHFLFAIQGGVGKHTCIVHTARPLYNNIHKPAVIIAACLNINGKPALSINEVR